MFSIENQMQGIPLARSPQGKKHKHMTQIKKRNKRKNEKHIKKENKENKEKRNKRKTKKNKNKKQKERKTSHRFAISTQSPLWKLCLENGSQKSCCSDL